MTIKLSDQNITCQSAQGSLVAELQAAQGHVSVCQSRHSWTILPPHKRNRRTVTQVKAPVQRRQRPIKDEWALAARCFPRDVGSPCSGTRREDWRASLPQGCQVLPSRLKQADVKGGAFLGVEGCGLHCAACTARVVLRESLTQPAHCHRGACRQCSVSVITPPAWPCLY